MFGNPKKKKSYANVPESERKAAARTFWKSKGKTLSECVLESKGENVSIKFWNPMDKTLTDRFGIRRTRRYHNVLGS